MKDINEGLDKWLPLIAMERAGLRVLSISQLKKQLDGKKDDAAIMFFDWHHKGGEMSFPTELRIIDLKNYDIHIKHPMDSFESISIPKEIEKGKMVMFKTDGLPRYSSKFRGDVKPGETGVPLPQHLTVRDFKNKISELDEKAFFAVKHHGNNFVSPDVLANYNAETYPLVNNKGQLVAPHLGMDGDILTFGLGSTMSTEWGPFSFSLEPKSLFKNSPEPATPKKKNKPNSEDDIDEVRNIIKEILKSTF